VTDRFSSDFCRWERHRRGGRAPPHPLLARRRENRRTWREGLPSYPLSWWSVMIIPLIQIRLSGVRRRCHGYPHTIAKSQKTGTGLTELS